MLQLKRMLPVEGWLTERMARLREKAHLVRKGHIARIEDIQGHISSLPPIAKRNAARELAARYKELKLDQRLERLDKAVAENERRIRELARQAQAYVIRHKQDAYQANGIPAMFIYPQDLAGPRWPERLYERIQNASLLSDAYIRQVYRTPLPQ